MDNAEEELPLPFSLATQFIDELIENRFSRADIAGALSYAVSDAAHRTANPLVLYAVVRGFIDGCIGDQTGRESEDKFAPRILPEGVEELRSHEVLFDLTDADLELLDEMEEQNGISKEECVRRLILKRPLDHEL
tara:strand:+ start:25009 stop:25413 length:405 start_codon:yes stop_codon:yes gene_type:complete